jgi:DNA-binding response OmpR family regulator
LDQEGKMQSVFTNPEQFAQEKGSLKRKKILIVDDEPFILKSLSFVLMKEGFQIETANNGLEAMEKIRKNKPDIVFLDIMMPKKNGMEVCQWIREDPVLRSMYVIILTAKGQELDREKGFSIGADEYMTKPFSPSSVVKRLKEILQ